MRTRYISLLPVLCVGALTFGAGVAQAGDAAVSDINIKLSAFGGGLNEGTSSEHPGTSESEGFGGVAGSLTLPLHERLGLQFDVAGAWERGESFLDAGAHLFWRDPGTGLFGLYGGFAHHHALGGQQVRRIGVEAERYSGKMTYVGALGYENGDGNTGLYGHAKLDYYWTPNLMTSSGFTYEGTGFYASRIEWQLRSDDTIGFTLFTDSNVHSSDNYTFLAGVRMTIGEDMSLMDRHRHQDPSDYLGADLIATEQGEAKRCGGGACTAPPTPQ